MENLDCVKTGGVGGKGTKGKDSRDTQVIEPGDRFMWSLNEGTNPRFLDNLNGFCNSCEVAGKSAAETWVGHLDQTFVPSRAVTLLYNKEGELDNFCKHSLFHFKSLLFKYHFIL